MCCKLAKHFQFDAEHLLVLMNSIIQCSFQTVAIQGWVRVIEWARRVRIEGQERSWALMFRMNLCERSDDSWIIDLRYRPILGWLQWPLNCPWELPFHFDPLPNLFPLSYSGRSQRLESTEEQKKVVRNKGTAKFCSGRLTQFWGMFDGLKF